MSKRLLSIILFLSLSLFLVMPVHAQENIFTKQTGVYTTDLDYRNSLVDWNGFNIEFNIFWDKRGGASPPQTRVYIIDESNSVLYTLATFDYDEETEMYKLRTTAIQNNYIKATLFDRTAEQEKRKILIDWTNNQSGFILFEIRLQFKSLLNVNFGSIYTDDTYGLNNVDMQFNKIITFYKDGLPITGINLDDETSQSNGIRQRALYNFTNTITNIDVIYLSYTISKPITAIPYNGNISLREIGLFASSQVVLPDLDIDTDFQIYEPTICGILDLGCVSRNLIGEFSNNIYNKLGAENIALGVMSIYDTLFYPVYIIDDTSWQNGIISIYAIISIGVLYLIVKRVLS